MPKENAYGPIDFVYKTCDCAKWRSFLYATFQRLKESNLPERFKKAKIEDWKALGDLDLERVIRIIENCLMKESKNWIFISGPAGTGKSFLASVMAKISLFYGRDIYYADVVSLLDDLRPDSVEPEKSAFVLKRTKKCDLLILDDLGQEKATEWVRTQVYSIINARWSAGKPTIITSNFSMERLKVNISEAVYSRVKGESLDLLLTGKDLRI